MDANFFGRCCVVFNYKTVAKEILLQIRESFQGHPTRIITYLVLRLYKLLASWFVSAQILTMNISRSPQREVKSFIIDSWFMNFSSVFKKSLFTTMNQTVKNTCRYIKSHKHKLCQPRSVHGVSVMWCVRGYLTIFTVNNLGCGHLLSAKENLKVFSRGKWVIKMLEETPDILSIFNAPKRS